MAKKNSQFSDDEFNETTEQVVGEPVDTDVNPDGITIDPSTDDSEKVTVTTDAPVVDENPVTTDATETPVVENPIPDATVETPAADENPSTPDSETPVDEGTDETPDTSAPDVDEKPNDKEPVKLNEFKRFDIRFGYSVDSRSTTTRRNLSTTEIVKQFVKAPTCFISFETKEDLKDFETLLKAKTIKVEDKEGKLVEFSDAAKKHLIERVTELSKYWIAKNSK